MDVRCENCKTEYELDEARLKPGGITVKCASCGHMFKIRKRPVTASFGAPKPAPAPAPAPAAPQHSAAPIAAAASSSGPTSRTWLIRLRDGEIKTCQELKFPQTWIVAGEVTRDAHISRNGQTWKPLGDIPELESYFRIADEARGRAASQPPVAAAPPPTSSSSPTVLESPLAVAPPAMAAPAMAAATPRAKRPQLAGDRATAGWAVQGAKAVGLAQEEERVGPTGGLKKGIPTTDVAFAGNKRSLKESFGGYDEPEIDDLFEAPRGGAGKWIVVVSLVVLAGAAVALYFLVLRAPGKSTTKAASAEVAGDAGAVDPAALAGDAGPAPDHKAELLAAAHKHLLADDQAALATMVDSLGKLEAADSDAAILVARARVEAAVAQSLVLQAQLQSEAKEARRLRTEAGKRAQAGLKLAKKATAIDRDDESAKAITAELMRLLGQRTRDIERELRKVFTAAPRNREARLTRARLLVRQNKLSAARKWLASLDGGEEAMEKTGDVRPRLALALIDFTDKKYDEARKSADAVLALQPEHLGAKLLVARINQETKVAGDPGNSGTGPSGAAAPGIDAYDGLVAKANAKAENGSCREAMTLYRRALDANPAGVAALTGMGYCHIEFKQFASALHKFRAALGVSSRYQGAMYGIGEAYQQQGLKAQAIAAYKQFIAAHPSSGRAKMARRQIERLGGSVADKPKDPAGASPKTKPPNGSGSAPKAPEEKPKTGEKPSEKPKSDKPAEKPKTETKPAPAPKPEPKPEPKPASAPAPAPKAKSEPAASK